MGSNDVNPVTHWSTLTERYDGCSIGRIRVFYKQGHATVVALFRGGWEHTNVSLLGYV